MTGMKDVASNYVVQVMGKVLSIILGLITVGVLTRHLGDEGFGEYTTAVTYLSLFGVFVDFGLTLTLVQMVCARKSEEERLVGNIFGLRLVSGAVFYALAPISVMLLTYPDRVESAVAAGALGFLFMSSAGMLVGVFQNHLAMWRFAIAELINKAIYLALVIGFSIAGFDVVSMLVATTIANGIWLIAVLHYARPLVRITPRFELTVWKDALVRSAPMALSIFFNLIYLRGDILLLAHFREQAEVGQYGVAYKVIDVLTVVPIMFMGLLLPRMTEAWVSRDRAGLKTFLQHAFDFFAIIVIPIAIGAQVVGPELTVLIAGDGYEAAGSVLKILAFALIAVFGSSLWGHAVVAIEKQGPMMWGYGITAAIALAGYLTIVPEYGMWGAAWVTLVCESLIMILTAAMVFKTTGAFPSLSLAAKALAASALMYVVLTVMPKSHVLIEVVIGATIYAATLLGTGGVKLSTIRELLPGRKPC